MIGKNPSDLRGSGHATGTTRMSGLHPAWARPRAAKSARSLGLPPMARRVHSLPLVTICAATSLLATGCPPPPLSLDEPDAPPNSPPGILSVRNETGSELAIGVGTGVNPVIIGISTMTLTLFDSDVEDTLFVRGFFDYDLENPSSAPANCNVGPSTPRSFERTVTCNLAAFCSADDVGEQHQLDVLACDRPPDDSGSLVPAYYNCGPDGTPAIRVYQVLCQEAPPT